MPVVRQHQCARDAEAQRAGLAGLAAPLTRAFTSKAPSVSVATNGC